MAGCDPLKETNEIEVQVRGIGSGGVGIADLPDGRILFVPLTAPGDHARVMVTHEKERWARGELVSILSEGPARRAPACTRYQECGGCTLQHLEYPEQLIWKSRIVGDALRRIGKLDVGNPEVEASPAELQYRNKLSITLRRLPGGRIVAGFHQRGRRDRILDIGSECQLPIPPLAGLWDALRAGWGPEANRLPRGRQLRLTLRVLGEAGSLLIQGGTGDGRPADLLASVPGLASLWREDSAGALHHLAGEEALSVTFQGQHLELRGGAFLQVNAEATAALHQHVLERAQEVGGKRIVDAYCGVGVLGRALAEKGGQVLGIEADPMATRAAGLGCPEGFGVVEGRVEDHLSRHLPADLLILNPPRGGLDSEIPPLITSAPPDQIIYVSCDPATLARDLSRLDSSHRLMSLRSFDLFPQTSHVESVAVMAKRVPTESENHPPGNGT